MLPTPTAYVSKIHFLLSEKDSQGVVKYIQLN